MQLTNRQARNHSIRWALKQYKRWNACGYGAAPMWAWRGISEAVSYATAGSLVARLLGGLKAKTQQWSTT